MFSKCGGSPLRNWDGHIETAAGVPLPKCRDAYVTVVSLSTEKQPLLG